MPNITTLEMSEAVLQTRVIDLARTFGWLVNHGRPARKLDGGWSTPIQGDKGFPDLTLVRPPFTMFVELKSEKGRLTTEQAAWLEGLRKCGHDARVWRPSDMREIEETLR